MFFSKSSFHIIRITPFLCVVGLLTCTTIPKTDSIKKAEEGLQAIEASKEEIEYVFSKVETPRDIRIAKRTALKAISTAQVNYQKVVKDLEKCEIKKAKYTKYRNRFWSLILVIGILLAIIFVLVKRK